MRISRRQLASSLLATIRFAERAVIADFVAADTTDFAPNSFPHTSAGVVRYVWTQRGSEFRPLGVMAIGLQDLLMALSVMDADEPVTQEILRAGPHTANVFHHGTGSSSSVQCCMVDRVSPSRRHSSVARREPCPVGGRGYLD